MRALRGAAGLALISVLLSCTQYPELDGGSPGAPQAGPARAEAAPPAAAGGAVYTPPTAGTVTAPARSFTASRSKVVRSIRNQARAEGLEVTHRDNARGLVVARYEGPATDYVDCGTYSIPGSTFGAPAIAAGLNRPTASIAGATQVNQDTYLNARLVAQVERQSNSAAAAHVAAHYVLRRDLFFTDDAGNEIERIREFIDLEPDRPARFSDNTACVATGALERSVLPAGGVDLGS